MFLLVVCSAQPWYSYKSRTVKQYYCSWYKMLSLFYVGVNKGKVIEAVNFSVVDHQVITSNFQNS